MSGAKGAPSKHSIIAGALGVVGLVSALAGFLAILIGAWSMLQINQGQSSVKGLICAQAGIGLGLVSQLIFLGNVFARAAS